MKTLNLNLRRILREAKEPGILLKDNLLTTLNGLKDKISAIAEEDGDAFFSALDGAGLKKSGDSLFQSTVVDEPETKKAQARWTELGGGGSSSSEPKSSPAAAPASSAPENKGTDGADPKPAEAPKPSSPSKAEPSSGSDPGGKKGTDAPTVTPSNPGGFGGGAPASEPKTAEPKPEPGTDPKPKSAETPKPSGDDSKQSGSGDAGNKGKSSGGGGDIGQSIAEIWNKLYQEAKPGKRIEFEPAISKISSLPGVEEFKKNGTYPGWDILTKDKVFALVRAQNPSEGNMGNAGYDVQKSGSTHPVFDIITSIPKTAWVENTAAPKDSQRGKVQTSK